MTYNEVVKYLEKEIKDRKLGYEYFLGQGHYPDEDKLKNIANIQVVLDFINRQNEQIHSLVDALDNSTKEFLKLHDEYQKQKAEIDDLKRDDLQRCKDALRRANEIGIDLEKENQKLKAEIERLEEKTVEYEKLPNDKVIQSVNAVSEAHRKYENALEEQLKTVKAEAYKEFAERVKKIVHEKSFDAIAMLRIWGEIDNLVKEMTGENNGN